MIGIYKITNKQSQKSYIGQSIHCGKRFDEHINGNQFIDKMIQKEGIENFTFELLKRCEPQDLSYWEDYYIIKYNTMFPNGYNKRWNNSLERREQLYTHSQTKTKHLKESQKSTFHSNKKLYHIKNVINKNESIVVKWEDYVDATRRLSPSGLSLYMYLAKNQDGYKMYFSPKDYCSMFSITDKTYRNAKTELKRYGYIKEGESNNVYFDAHGGYAETKESVKEKLITIYERVKEESQEDLDEFAKQIYNAQLPKTDDEQLYIIKAKQLISFGRKLLQEAAQKELSDLL